MIRWHLGNGGAPLSIPPRWPGSRGHELQLTSYGNKGGQSPSIGHGSLPKTSIPWNMCTNWVVRSTEEQPADRANWLKGQRGWSLKSNQNHPSFPLSLFSIFALFLSLYPSSYSRYFTPYACLLIGPNLIYPSFLFSFSQHFKCFFLSLSLSVYFLPFFPPLCLLPSSHTANTDRDNPRNRLKSVSAIL